MRTGDRWWSDNVAEGGVPWPRQRLLAHGSESLSDVELLAVCLGTGIAGVGVLDYASQLLNRFGGLGPLASAHPSMLLDYPGLGPARAARLLAGFALSERRYFDDLIAAPVLSSSESVRGYLRHKLAGSEREIFGCLFLDARHRLIAYESMFLGTVDRASVHPREVLQRALKLNAAALILAHNHPSGIAEPSPSDIALTDTLRTLLANIEVKVLDHVVVGRGSLVSFAERGLI